MEKGVTPIYSPVRSHPGEGGRNKVGVTLLSLECKSRPAYDSIVAPSHLWLSVIAMLSDGIPFCDLKRGF